MTAENSTYAAGFGPYTVLDLHDLPEDGKGFELEDGWLIEVAAGARHNWIARRLARIIEAAGGDSVVALDGGEWEVSTPGGVRKPDVAVVPKDLARAVVLDQSPRLIPGPELLLVVEVVSPGSGSERTDRVRKVREYAGLGIPEYWLVEHQPAVRIHRARLDGASYHWEPAVDEGTEFAADVEWDKPFRVVFDPAALLDI
ncbi:Uma2 family endonuclease [Nocardia blacklockiae]|uniref:Uma2 family endonuclease n=1 Tax=Nocardia blacklockiae TaxID=480036 RepID=UPI0018930CF2|nr:Uma2 family endonuclease [Nocardia blacklockiae]MBF6173706.1 Uma2 family endonuclease [Nocardia blacklockiae]